MKVEELLEDAHLVASFGQRAGKLRSGELFDAIQKAEIVKTPLSWANPEVATLQMALSSAVNDIAPITLLDLKRGFDPYRSDRMGAEKGTALRVGLIISAVILLVFAAHFSIWQGRATNLLHEFEKDKGQSQQLLVNDLIPTVVTFEASAASFDEFEDAGSLSRSAFRDKVYQLREITSEMVNDQRNMHILNNDFNPATMAAGSITAAAMQLFDMFSGDPPVDKTKVPTTDAAKAAENATRALYDRPEDWPEGLSNLASYKRCFARKTSNLKTVTIQSETLPDQPAVYGFGSLVQRDDALVQKVRCLVGIRAIEEQFWEWGGSVQPAILERKLTILSLWLLPAIYGAFGAVLFHLRICHDPMRPDPRKVHAVLRIFMGAFAGVSLAWFWQPGDDGNVQIANVSIGALTAAFLVGFGIDAFFRLLDRMVTLLNKASESLGTDKTKGRAAAAITPP